jgi:phosphoribosyl 1,2-cyclic phosphodiesterase
MKVTLWGTRGSLATPGPETVRYGGNTSCVEVRGSDGTLLVLDAGTGIRRLGATVGPEAGRVDVLLTHLHMDHIQGLGFFRPLDQPGQEVHIWGPPSTTLDLRARLGRYLSPPLFPVRLRDLPCELTLHDAPLDGFQIGALSVKAALVCHPGPTLGYRITEDGVSMAYLPDHEPALGAQRFPGRPDWTSGFALAHGVDLLIHDSQYSAAQYARHVGWGHSAIPHTLAFAATAGVKRLVTFHHDPRHDDSTLDRLLQEARAAADLPFELSAGTEGACFDLDGRAAGGRA